MVHKGRGVSMVQWSPEGTRLISGDQVKHAPRGSLARVACSSIHLISILLPPLLFHRQVQAGTIGVWQGDQRGRMLPVCQYAKRGAVTHCVFQVTLLTYV
jgi:hypothetical protein